MLTAFMCAWAIHLAPQSEEVYEYRSAKYRRGPLVRQTKFTLEQGEVLTKEKRTSSKSMSLSLPSGAPIIVVVSGTGKYASGGEFDNLVNAIEITGTTDRPSPEFLPYIGPVGQREAKPSHEYAGFGFVGSTRTLTMTQKYTGEMDYQKYRFDYVISGAFTVSVYEATTGESLKLNAVDASRFAYSQQPSLLLPNPRPTEGFPLVVPVLPEQYSELSALGDNVKGAVADGTTLLLLRCSLPSKGQVTFKVDGNGALYRVDENPFLTSGTSSLQVRSKEVARTGYAEEYAFALYRVPESIGQDDRQTLSLYADFKPDQVRQPLTGFLTISLYPTPVVLVHGTYDNPKECFQTKDPDDGPTTMEEALSARGLKVSSVDWEKTNGREDPSEFKVNQLTIYENVGGIRDTLASYRKQGIAATRADVIAHSQGGVISRVFARGRSLDTPMPTNHPHFSEPQKCRAGGCWYHHARNFGYGDIRRLITLSSTHKGSDIPRLFSGISKLQERIPKGGASYIELDQFVSFLQSWMTGVRTGGFKDQVPGSDAQSKIGPTPVAAHAIASVCTDEDMEKSKSGYYLGRLTKLWSAIPNYRMRDLFTELGQKEQGDELFDIAVDISKAPSLEKSVAALRKFRQVAFKGDLNDCVVGRTSAIGGLSDSYTTTVERVIHSWSPRNRVIQDRIIQLLETDLAPFELRGFPHSITGQFGSAGALPVPALNKAGKVVPIEPVRPVVDNQKRTEIPNDILEMLGTYDRQWRSGDLRGAEATLAKAISDHKTDAKLRAMYGNFLLSQQRFAEALPQFKSAIELEPKSGVHQAALGTGYAWLRRFPEAELAYREAIKLESANGRHHAGLAFALLQQGRFADAEVSAREALRLDPKAPEHQLYVADSLAFQNKWMDAEAFYRECIRLNPKLAAGHNGLGGCFIARSDGRGAEGPLREAVRLQPNEGQFHANLAGAFQLQNKLQEARIAAQEAKRLGIRNHWVFGRLNMD